MLATTSQFLDESCRHAHDFVRNEPLVSASSAGYLAGLRFAQRRSNKLAAPESPAAPAAATKTSRRAKSTKTATTTEQIETQTRTHKSIEKAASDAQSGSLGSLAAIVPTEALTLYVAGWAWIASNKVALPDIRLTILVIACGIVSAVVLGVRFSKGAGVAKVSSNAPAVNPLRAREYWISLVVTEVAFGAYVIALPHNPFGYDLGWTGFIAIIAAAVLGFAANWIGPNADKS